jgi:hypothetical protein
LGNLVLLPRRKNLEASNWEFEKKKKAYFTSKKGVSTFALTTRVLAEDSWTPAIVERRQEDCLATLRRVWGLGAT